MEEAEVKKKTEILNGLEDKLHRAEEESEQCQKYADGLQLYQVRKVFAWKKMRCTWVSFTSELESEFYSIHNLHESLLASFSCILYNLT